MSALKTFVTIDPGHFHAALVQKRAWPDVSPRAMVFAPDGAGLQAHLRLVESFNTRRENPTAWREDVFRGADYLEKFSAAARAGALGECPVAVLAGRNDLKGDYALAAVEAGCNVLSDKPMAITPDVFAKTEKAARLALEKGLRFADMMTERNEITAIVQRELAMDEALYGRQEAGSPDDPALVQSSVHHFFKSVNGVPLTRPEWYYDTGVQGEGIVDVTSHLVDLIQWSAFPGVRLDKDDVGMVSAEAWPTVISPQQYRMSTGAEMSDDLYVNANGEFVWSLRGVCCKVRVEWNFAAPDGAGDTRYSLMRGTKSEIVVRQGADDGWKSAVYVRAREDAARTRQALDAAVERMSRKWPGLRAVESSEPGLWRVVIPEEYAVGHEAHFGQTVRTFFDWIDAGAEEPHYIDNMIVKYHTICEAWKQRSVAGGVLPAGSHPSKDHAE